MKDLTCDSCYGEPGICICNTSSAAIEWRATFTNGTTFEVAFFHAGSEDTTSYMRGFLAEYYNSSNSSSLSFNTSELVNNGANITCINGGDTGSGGQKHHILIIAGIKFA